ncbi:MAG: hypothetical protein JSV04_02200 [Candidatus Heimdallarchaeota archaeon]|nr:MAG: hypothetical protein JSV04_02200 [Candidatus Heimdallarchaeota archaeon]
MSKEIDVKLFGQQIWSPSDSKEVRTRLVGLGIFVNVIWILSVFVRPVIDPLALVALGGIGLIITVGTRLQARTLQFAAAGEVSGGSIAGYIVSLFLVHLGYPNKAYQFVFTPQIVFTVNQLLIYYFVLVFFIWFAIPAKKTSNEIIFGFPPLFSYFILNLWKLAVILEILTLLEELSGLRPYAGLLFIFIGFAELILQYFRLFKVPIADIILDPLQLFLKIIEGPVQTLKWSLLVILFLIMDLLPLDLFSAGLVAFSITMGVISLTTALSKIVLDSGIIKSRTDKLVDEGKVVIPQIFEELREVEASDLQEFYQVTDPISIKKENKIVTYERGDVLLKVPFTATLEKEVGVFLAHLKFRSRRSPSKIERRRKRKSVVYFKTATTPITVTDGKRKDINISSLHRVPLEEWTVLKRKKQVVLVDPQVITKAMGFDSPEEFEEVVGKGIRGAVSLQEGIRDRIRGVPVITSISNSQVVKLEGKRIEVPDELLEQIDLAEDQEIELIPGKEEFLFYAKIKKRKES